MLICKDANNDIRWREGERLDHLYERRCDELTADGKADHKAVIIGDTSYTFGDIDARANQLARYLLRQNIGDGDRVGVLFDKSVETYIAILAILKVGAAYVPFDASFPSDRIGFILEDAEVKALVSMSVFADKLAEFKLPTILLDDVADKIQPLDDTRLSDTDRPAPKEQLAYIIYTSGTTGKPKGVTIEHASICNFVTVAAEVYGITANDISYQGMTIAFDFSVEELWVPLIAGATLIPGKPATSLVGEDLADYLFDHKITYLCIVPTLLATIERDLPDLKTVLVSGEACPANLVERWQSKTRRMLNAYGPTEATVTCTLTELYPDKPVTIGGPLPTYTIVILEEDNAKEVADGGMGEVCVAGIGLARDYLKRPELTAEKFIPDFLDIPHNPSKRIYRTGDLGKINKEGEVEFHGRIDTQIKLRGYRIELTEIESVLMEIPDIAQAVVDTHESAPGQVDLVAYYSLKPGAPDVPRNDVSKLLRARLPHYMVPTYFEYLPVIPMTSSHKADRKALPPPTGARFVAETPYIAPNSATETTLAGVIGEIMNLDKVSIEDNFFKDLGAHSLLMAQFGAKLRNIPGIADVSMRDIYLNPTIEQLAAFVDQAGGSAFSPSVPLPKQEELHIPTDFDYYRCGALQILFTTTYSLFFLWLVITCIEWTYAAAGNPLQLYGRIVVYSLGTFVVLNAIPIAAKWLLIGKWKAQTFPVWGMAYLRFWIVKSLIRTAPMAALGGPMRNLYLRLLGAKIGRNAAIQSAVFPVTTDLFAIGNDTILRKDSIIPGYTARANKIILGPVEFGSNVFVGEGSVVDINTIMEDNTQLGHSSSLQNGQHVERGTHVHGSPAQPTKADYCQVEPMAVTPLRRWLYTAFQIVPAFLIYTPLFVFILYAAFPYILSLLGATPSAVDSTDKSITNFAIMLLPVSLLLLVTGLITGLAIVLFVPRLLNRFLQEDKTYIRYGFHYFIHRSVAAISNSKFYNLMFGDSSYIVYYLQWLGYKLNKIEQTGSNFGTNQKHDNPYLCEIGSGTMVSDGLSMINAQTGATSFKLTKVKVGDHNYLGNVIYYPSDSKAGANCLLGTKVMIPIDGPVRENCGLLGSPSFEIPRITDRDKDMGDNVDKQTRKSQIAKKNAHNIMTVALYLLSNWLFLYVGAIAGYAMLSLYPVYGLPALIGVAVAMALFTISYFTITERASLHFRDLKPQTVTVYGEYFWFHERHWKFCETPLPKLFKGTPMKNVISRLLGVKVGHKVFDDGAQFLEKTLITIGDHATLNQSVTLQAHSLEEGVFKSDYIKIGNGCTLGCNAFVHYSVNMGDNVELSPDAFLMKGEELGDNSTWRGNPARQVGEFKPNPGVGVGAKPRAHEVNLTAGKKSSSPNGKFEITKLKGQTDGEKQPAASD